MSRDLFNEILFGVYFVHVSPILIPNDGVHEEFSQRDTLGLFFSKFKVVLVVSVNSHSRSYLNTVSLIVFVKQGILIHGSTLTTIVILILTPEASERPIITPPIVRRNEIIFTLATLYIKMAASLAFALLHLLYVHLIPIVVALTP